MTDTAAIDRNIRRIRKDIRVLSRQMQAEIDADQDCSATAQKLMRAQVDLRLYLEKRADAVPPVNSGTTEERSAREVIGGRTLSEDEMSQVDRYEDAVDQAIAACGGDMRGALKALIIANEFLEKLVVESAPPASEEPRHALAG